MYSRNPTDSGAALKALGLVTALGLSLLLTACETPLERKAAGRLATPAPAPSILTTPTVITTPEPRTIAKATLEPDTATGGNAALQGPEFYRGTGELTGSGPLGSEAAISNEGGRVTLNFVNAEVREVIDVVLGETLRVNYIIDPAVQGLVTVRTSQPLARSAVIPTLSDVLAMNGATIALEEGIYRILPRAAAGGGLSAPIVSQTVRRLAQGYGINVLPLNYVSAAEIAEILQPFVTPGTLRVDQSRNLLLFAGDATEALDLEEMIRLFDVDWMSGMSFALLPARVAQADDLVSELESVFAQDQAGPTSGVVRFLPIERLNAVLVISPQAAYLERARLWVERLDRGGQSAGRQIFVYYVENGRAVDLAETLSQVFETSGQSRQGRSAAGLAPGLVPAELSSRDFQAPQPGQANQTGDLEFTQSVLQDGGLEANASTLVEVGVGQAVARAIEGDSAVRIIADESSNALLILATSAEFEMIEATLKRLDIVPLQVLIEATIAEVTLNDDLRYGLNWFFEHGDVTAAFSTTTAAAASQVFPGFSFLFDSGDAAVVLNALTEITDVNIISSPQLMVLDNESARLQVGDEVPVATQSAVSVTDPDAPVVNSIQLIDTGVVLEVTPRVNPGGLVRLEIVQEVSTPVTTTTSAIDSPTIQQRRVESTVVVQSGETIALGGLITDNQTQGVSGVPVISSVPLFGNLFKTTTESVTRTELLILITPRVVRNAGEARAVTEELRRRLTNISPLENKIRKTIQSGG